MRSPGDRSLYLVVDKPGEHIRFRYLHMNPQMLDAAGMVSGREVAEGEVLGAVGNYGRAPGGTTYHLHFDAQVPTRDGWVFVNPYMTLVAAYERLIGARGQVVNDAMFATAPAPAPVAADGQAPGVVVGPRADAKQSIDDSMKIESEPGREHEAAPPSIARRSSIEAIAGTFAAATLPKPASAKDTPFDQGVAG
jgi:murein DD-endopeptidase MepM/ murein hydrolase activator NlpD